jgi:hypothetical protein
MDINVQATNETARSICGLKKNLVFSDQVFLLGPLIFLTAGKQTWFGKILSRRPLAVEGD